jgi:hypothetical protein
MTMIRKPAGVGRWVCACLFVVPIAYFLLTFSILILFTTHSYDGIIHWYKGWRPDAFDAGSMVVNCLTPQWYAWVNAHRLLLIIGLAAMLCGYVLYSRRVWAFLRDFCREAGRALRLMADSYRESSGRERAWLWILFSCLLAYRLYMCLVFPLNTDELGSYLYFARQGFLVTLTSYPVPNNHILFNLVAASLAKLPFLSPELVIRLPSVAGDLWLQYAIFCLVRRWGGFQRGIMVVAGTAFCYMISYYATQGRGYQLQEVCALVSGVGAWRCFLGQRGGGARGGGARGAGALFVLASAAGIYINPTFFYHFTALVLMVLYFSWKRRDWGMALSLGRAVLVTGVLTFILYLPVLMAGKMGGVQTMDRGSAGWMIDRLWELVYDLRVIGYYGSPGMVVVCVVVVVLLVLYSGRKLTGPFYSIAVVYLACALLSLAIWSLMMKDYPWARTICWLVLALYLVFVNACYDLWKTMFPWVRPWIFWGFLLIRGVGSLRGLYRESSSVNGLEQTKIYRELEPDLEQLAALHPATWQITRSDDFYPMFLRLYLVEHNSSAGVLWNKGKAVGDIIFLPAIYESYFPKEGYVLWGRRELTVEGKSMEIYVSKQLLLHRTF